MPGAASEVYEPLNQYKPVARNIGECRMCSVVPVDYSCAFFLRNSCTRACGCNGIRRSLRPFSRDDALQNPGKSCRGKAEARHGDPGPIPRDLWDRHDGCDRDLRQTGAGGYGSPAFAGTTPGSQLRSFLWNAASNAPSASSAAETFSAYERLPSASVIAPTAIGPSVWPMPNAMVMTAMPAGQPSTG